MSLVALGFWPARKVPFGGFRFAQSCKFCRNSPTNRAILHPNARTNPSMYMYAIWRLSDFTYVWQCYVSNRMGRNSAREIVLPGRTMTAWQQCSRLRGVTWCVRSKLLSRGATNHLGLLPGHNVWSAHWCTFGVGLVDCWLRYCGDTLRTSQRNFFMINNLFHDQQTNKRCTRDTG